MTNIQKMQKHLSTLRKSLGWTQAELSDKLQMSRNFVTKLENGQLSMSMVYYLAIKCLIYEELSYYKYEKIDEGTYMALVLMDCYIDNGDEWFDSNEKKDDVLEAIDLFAEGGMGRHNDPRKANIAFCKWMRSNYRTLLH